MDILKQNKTNMKCTSCGFEIRVIQDTDVCPSLMESKMNCCAKPCYVWLEE